MIAILLQEPGASQYIPPANGQIFLRQVLFLHFEDIYPLPVSPAAGRLFDRYVSTFRRACSDEHA